MPFASLNTAQMQFFQENKRYAGLPELMSSPAMKKTSEMMPKSGNNALGTADDPLPGYNVRLLVAPDGKSYALSAARTDGPCKLLGAVTDERGIIFLTEPLH
jgi:hypothetical protein